MSPIKKLLTASSVVILASCSSDDDEINIKNGSNTEFHESVFFKLNESEKVTDNGLYTGVWLFVENIEERDSGILSLDTKYRYTMAITEDDSGHLYTMDCNGNSHLLPLDHNGRYESISENQHYTESHIWQFNGHNSLTRTGKLDDNDDYTIRGNTQAIKIAHDYLGDVGGYINISSAQFPNGKTLDATEYKLTCYEVSSQKILENVDGEEQVRDSKDIIMSGIDAGGNEDSAIVISYDDSSEHLQIKHNGSWYGPSNPVDADFNNYGSEVSQNHQLEGEAEFNKKSIIGNFIGTTDNASVDIDFSLEL